MSETAGDIYVADSGNNRIDQFSSSGTFIRAFGADVGGAGMDICTSGCQAGSTGSAPNQLNAPRFVEVDNSAGSSAGDVYVADGTNHVVHKFDSTGNLITSWATGGAFEFAKKEGPIGGITVDGAGALYVVTDAKPYNWTLLSPETGAVTAAYPTDNTWFGGERLDLNVPGRGGIEVGADGTWYETQPPSAANERQGGVWYSSPLANEYTFFWMYPIVRGAAGKLGHRVRSVQPRPLRGPGGPYRPLPEGQVRDRGLRADGHVRHRGTGLRRRPRRAGPRTTCYMRPTAKTTTSRSSCRVPLPEVTTTGPTDVTTTARNDERPCRPRVRRDRRGMQVRIPARIDNNEVQELSFSGAARREFHPQIRRRNHDPAIQYPPGPFGASTILFRLEELPAIGKGNVEVTFPSGRREEGPYYIEFNGRFEDLDVPQITVDDSGAPARRGQRDLSTKYPGNGWKYAQTAPCNPAPPLSAPTDVSAALRV